MSDRNSGALRWARWAFPAVILLCAVLYTLELGDLAFLGKDEPKNAQTAREMLNRGDWVTTTLEGEPWYDKPILYYWSALVGYLVFGVGELGARIGPVITALLTIWFTFLLGRRMLDEGKGSEAASAIGALAALIIGSSMWFAYYARTAVTDSLLTAFVTGTLVGYFFAKEGVRPVLNMNLAWASMAMAALAKGPVGIVLPVMVVGADLLFSRRRDWFRFLQPWTGALIFAAVAGPWYTLVTLRSNGQFLYDFIFHYNIERFTTDKLPHQEPFYYFPPAFLVTALPWSVFIPTALARMFRGRVELSDQQRARDRYLLLWILLPVFFFSLSKGKLPSYLLPIYPATSVVVAAEIRRLVRAPGRTPAPLWISVSLLAVLSVVISVAGFQFAAFGEEGLLELAAPLFTVLLVTGLGALVLLALRMRRASIVMVALSGILFPTTFLLSGREFVEKRTSAREIALQAMALEPGPGELLSWRFYDNTFFFYTDATAERVNKMPRLRQRVQEKGSVLCFVRATDLPDC